MNNETQELDLFEVAMRAEPYCWGRTHFERDSDFPGQRYAYAGTQAAWSAWKAARKLSHSDSRDASLGRVAIRFIDRAGDIHPGIDDAEDICAEFHQAMSVELAQWLPPETISAYSKSQVEGHD